MSPLFLIITISAFGVGLLTSICLQIASICLQIATLICNIVDSKKRRSELRPILNGEHVRSVEDTPRVIKRINNEMLFEKLKNNKNSDSEEEPYNPLSDDPKTPENEQIRFCK